MLYPPSKRTVKPRTTAAISTRPTVHFFSQFIETLAFRPRRRRRVRPGDSLGTAVSARLDRDQAPGEPASMPELPDVTVYVESLDRRLRGERLKRVRLVSFFVVRTATPRPA